MRLIALTWAAGAISRVSTLEVERTLSPEAVEVLVIVGMVGAPTRRGIEDLRGGEDCEGLLTRLCRRGFLETTRDDSLKGDPYVYRLTAVALGAMGHATSESFRAWCADAAAGVVVRGR